MLRELVAQPNCMLKLQLNTFELNYLSLRLASGHFLWFCDAVEQL